MTEVTLRLRNGQSAAAYLATPPGGSGPAVLLLHAWWGLNPFFRRQCERIAAEGFVVLAPDFYVGNVATTQEQAQAFADQLDPVAATATVCAGLDYLLHLDAVTSAAARVIGFSLGAHYALVAAATRPDDVAAVVLFYGTSDVDVAPARAAVLGHFAKDDPWEDTEWVEQMEQRLRDTGQPVTFYTYDAGHWFVEDDRTDAYAPVEAALAWERTYAFLRDSACLTTRPDRPMG